MHAKTVGLHTVADTLVSVFSSLLSKLRARQWKQGNSIKITRLTVQPNWLVIGSLGMTSQTVVRLAFGARATLRETVESRQ